MENVLTFAPENIDKFFSNFSPEYIDKLHFSKRYIIKRKFFTFSYYGKVVDSLNNDPLFNFKLNKNRFAFSNAYSDLGFNGEWIYKPRTRSGKLLNQRGDECVVTTPYTKNELRTKSFVMRELLYVNTSIMQYKLWCTSELNWIGENMQRLLVLSDHNNSIILRGGRTGSFFQVIDIINPIDEIAMLIPILFIYIINLPLPD
jgi:hypothetical protein